tara:strand:- start:58 stop:246 length:189 start_codon:yes stop_codon:yes gene_type:complete
LFFQVVFTYLLLFFGGALGIHRFYWGKWLSGLCYAFTFGIFGLGLIWDFFTIPFMVHSCRKR